MLALIDSGAEDITEVEDGFEVYTNPEDLKQVKEKVEQLGYEVKETEMQMKPKNVVEMDPKEQEKVIKFLNAFEENDDVQKVYSNF